MPGKNPLTIAQVLTLLAETPPRLAVLTTELTLAQMRTPPEPGAWSASDVLAHLRACADVWGGCIAAILAEDHPTLRAIDPRTWMEQTDYRELDFRSSLQAFAEQRADLLTVLEPLSREDWSRATTVTVAGKPLERTVHFYAQWLARHARTDLEQVASIVKVVGVSLASP